MPRIATNWSKNSNIWEVRVVVDEQTMLATAHGAGSGLEAWRPLLEGCSNDNWEWTVHSKAWAAEWQHNQQFPYLTMAASLTPQIAHSI